jgi:cytochrome c556
LISVRMRTLVGAALLLALYGCGTPAPNAGKPTSQAESMQSMLTDVHTLRDYAKGTGTRAEAEAAAANLVSWSDRMADLFPPETAAQYVDMTPDISRRAPPIMRETALAVAASVRAGNRADTGTRLARAERDGCGICHSHGYQQ